MGPALLGPADVHVVGTSEAIARVNDLEVLPDGSVWVLNSLAPVFIGFPSDGGPPVVHGALGGGPEEFRLPAAFVTGGIDGRAWVLDLRRHDLLEASATGAERGEIRLPRDSVPPGSLYGGMSMLSATVRTARMGGEVLLPRTTGSLALGLPAFRMAILGADLLALDLSTNAVRKVVSLRDALDDPSAGFELTDGAFPLWYRLWAVCGGDEIRVYDRTANQVRGFAADGTELAPVDLPPVTLTEVTQTQFALAVFDLRAAEIAGEVGVGLTAADSLKVVNSMARDLKGSPQQLAAYLPRYVDLRCSEDGTLWMQPLDPDRGNLAGSSAWLRIRRDGSTREVRFPDRFDPYRFTGGRIWGVQRDELDVASVAWIQAP